METQTRYDLVAAIENWRQELAAQSNLTDDARRELETHLRDTIAGFQQRGLGDEESFWLASRRLGPPQQLGEEFVKANPTAIWRERLTWMAQAVLIVALWNVTASHITMAVSPFIVYGHPARSTIMTTAFFHFATSFTVRNLPVFAVVILLLRGSSRKLDWLTNYFQSRRRFLIVGSVWLVGNIMLSLASILARSISIPSHRPVDPYAYVNLVSMIGWPLGLLILVAWLTGSERRVTPAGA